MIRIMILDDECNIPGKRTKNNTQFFLPRKGI